MRWSDRQTALLAELGIRLWPTPGGARFGEASAGPPAAVATTASDAGVTAGQALARPPAQRPAAQATTGIAEPTAPVVDAPVDGVSPGPESPAARAVEAARDAVAARLPPIPGTVPGAPAADARALDWPALRAAVAGCTACSLCRSRTQTVFGVGHPRAHWMVVGEAPGEQDDRQGEPFVGRSGQLLDSMLRAIGLSRGVDPAGDADDADPARCVYIANTLKCRPPADRNPAADELARCEGYLIRQIELVQPRMILAMGRFAVQSLLRSSEPIGRLRGRVHRYQDVPLVVTYHPAYLLRHLPEKARAWDDLCLALDALQAVGGPAPGPAGR